jgi:hypothetical protein
MGSVRTDRRRCRKAVRVDLLSHPATRRAPQLDNLKVDRPPAGERRVATRGRTQQSDDWETGQWSSPNDDAPQINTPNR